jgi:anti-sigma regulatory factor (Ser/Thr protein kinase)
LVVSELVTNACVHGAGPVTVTVWVDRRRLSLRVQDRGHWCEPKETDGDEYAPGGRGLTIVDGLADSVSIRRGRGGRGTCVIARFSAPPMTVVIERSQP